MIEFGKTLREAREAKGYSISQLAEITHILSHIIDQLEREDFSNIVAPIYGRGFVKLYCEAVGLETKPFVEAFMAIYNGEQPPAHENVVPPREEPPAADEEAPAPVAPPMPEAPREAASEPPRMASPNIFDAPPPAATAFDLPPREDDAPPRRDYRLPAYAIADVPSSFWRFGLLIAAAIAVIVALVFACRAVYRATMTAPADEIGEAPTVERAEAASASTPTDAVLPRQPGAIPPLYID